MTAFTARHVATFVGTLVALQVLLLGDAPAAWHLAGQQLSTATSAWPSAQTHGPRVAQAISVRISGTTRRPLRPGGSSRINLRFTNRSRNAVSLRHVRVTITRVSAPQADQQHPCGRADFRVRPMRAQVLVLPGRSSTDLVRLGVPSWRWPRLKMRNLPVNQDGCKSASLTLGYVGYPVWSG